MKFTLPVLFAVLSTATFAPAAEAPAPSAIAQAMQAALSYRTEMAAAVAGNRETAESALARLRSHGAVNGMSLPADADFGEAALEIGLRLIGAKRPAAAEVFFRAAEGAFDQEAQRTPVSQSREKARYLERLALVRGNYLNQAIQAKADIDEAIRLQPDDSSLKVARSKLARGRAVDFKSGQAGNTQEIKKN